MRGSGRSRVRCRRRCRGRSRGRGRGSSEKQVFFESSFQLAVGSPSLMLEAGQKLRARNAGFSVSRSAVGCASRWAPHAPLIQALRPVGEGSGKLLSRNAAAHSSLPSASMAPPVLRS